jgi:hypothetical protein
VNIKRKWVHTSVSRSEEDMEELVGEDGGGSISLVGSNIFLDPLSELIFFGTYEEKLTAARQGRLIDGI